jgi:hypothetical protein
MKASRRLKSTFLGKVQDELDIKSFMEDGLMVEDPIVRGDALWCKCPLHDESNRSFTIGLEGQYRGVWKCFGNGLCGSGNIFQLVSKVEKISFHDSALLLAKYAGVSENYSIGDLQKSLSRVNRQKKCFELKVPEIVGIEPDFNFSVRYLVEARGFPYDYAINLINRHAIGLHKSLFPNGRIARSLALHIRNCEGEIVDTFCELAYPQMDRNKRFAKNGKVGATLFDLDFITGRECVLVEGVWDCFRARQYGYPATTSFRNGLTQKQAEILVKRFDKIYLAFDADEGGRNGIKDISSMLSGIVNLEAVTLPDGLDPDDCSKRIFDDAMSCAGWI